MMNIEFFLKELEPKDPPEFVAKYQNWECKYHREALIGGYIFMANINDWDDTNDGLFLIRIGVHRNLWPNTSDEDIKKVEEELAREARQRLGNLLGIFCTSTGMNDPKCWDKFNKGNFENAYFIKFKYEGLKSIGIFPIKVIYRQQLLEFTYADGTEREHRGIETLRQKEDPIYGWEKEIRFFWTIPESVPANHHVYISQRQFRIFPEFIDSIQIHPHARKSLEDEIAQALKKTSYALIPILRASGTER